MKTEPVAIVELGGEVTWLTDVLPYKAKLYTHPAELTDEEIEDEVLKDKYWDWQGNLKYLDFAKAILRKAQEK